MSLMGLFDTLQVNDFAGSLPTLHVFVQVGFETKGSHTLVAAIRSEDGEYALEIQRRIDAMVEMEAEGLYMAEYDWKIDALKLPKPGRYRVYFVTDFVQELPGPCFTAKAAAPVALPTSCSRARQTGT